MEAIMYVHRNLTKFQSFGEVNTYQTRNANNLFIPYFSLPQDAKDPFITLLGIYYHLADYLKYE